MNRSSKLCAGMGHETKKPWMLSAPMARTASSSVGSSTPSTVTSMPTLWHSSMTASMNARLNASRWMSLMNRRSIFTMSAGDWASRPSDE